MRVGPELNDVVRLGPAYLTGVWLGIHHSWNITLRRSRAAGSRLRFRRSRVALPGAGS